MEFFKKIEKKILIKQFNNYYNFKFKNIFNINNKYLSIFLFFLIKSLKFYFNSIIAIFINIFDNKLIIFRENYVIPEGSFYYKSCY